MANGSLSFQLPEEQAEFDMACKAVCFNIVLSKLDEELRGHMRHNSHPSWDGQTVEDIRKILHDLRSEYSLFFD